MNSASNDDFYDNLPEYSGMPVNLVSGFANGDISYNLLASLFDQSSGNQVLDGTKSRAKNDTRLIPTDDLPHIENPSNGFIVAANN